MPVWQIGRPLDFLADSEEPHSARENGRREPPEAAPGLPEAASGLPEAASGVPDPLVPDPVLALPEASTKPPAQAVSGETEIIIETGGRGSEGRGARSGADQAENRCYTRFTLNAPATVWRESATIAGYVVNISLGGAFLRMNPSIPLHESVTLSVCDCANPTGLPNDLAATVIRTSEAGCALRFDRMLVERGVGDSMNLPLYSYR